jgi:hypothetical protein
MAADYQPQQSVLYPQAGQRQTACMRNISAVQRSQRTRSAEGLVAVVTGTDAMGGDGALGRAVLARGESDIARLYGRFYRMDG